MKTTLLTRSMLLTAALAAGAALTAADAQPTQVAVTFHESEKFTDVRSHWGGDTDEHYLKELAKHIEKLADRHIAPDQRLEVTFTDIDLAGDFVPGGRPGSENVRIIREIYIPRQKLSFRLLDAEGRVLKEGERRLSDLNFMNNLSLAGRNEPLFYDKELLTDWMRKEFNS
ncbi:MAG: DUF3016 domain-containing protein [Verrucomicrobiota bacterium]